MELDDFTSVLAQAEFFRICDDEQKRLIAFASEKRRFAPGDTIFQKGEMAQGAFVLMSGDVFAGQSEDQRKLHRISEVGAVLGEMGLFLEMPRRTTLRAATDVETMFVPRSAFNKLMRQYPQIAARAAQRIEDEMDNYLSAMESFRDS